MSVMDAADQRPAAAREQAELARLRARIRALETELAAVQGQTPAQDKAAEWTIYAGIIADASGPDGEDFVYEDATPATEAFFGRRLRNVRASEIGLAPEVIAATVAIIRQCDATGQAMAREHGFPAPGRETGWYFGTSIPLPRNAAGQPRISFHVTDIAWRRRAERAIAESEARFRTLAEAAPGIVFEGTAQGNVFVNRTYQDYTGLPAEALLGSGWLAVVHPEDVAAIAALVAAADRSGAPFEYEARIRRHDGAWRWFTMRAQGIPDAGGSSSRWYGVGVDIHERRTAEAALRDSEARFRALADSAPVLIWESDAAGRLTWFNRPWLDLTGRTLEQEIGDGWTAGIHPDDLPHCLAVFQDALARRAPYRMEYRLRRADGAWRTMAEAGAPRHAPDGGFLGFVGSCVDETEGRAARAALALSEETLRLAVEATQLGLWDVNLRSDALDWSPRCREMFGIFTDRPVSLEDFYSGLHPADRDATVIAYTCAIDPASRGDYDIEYRTIGLEDGVERWVAAKGRAFFDAEGRAIRAIGTTLDITARKRAETALLHATVELEARVAERTAQLAESEARFRAYFESVEDCLFTVTVAGDGTFIHEGYNPHGEQRTGYANAQSRGQAVAAFMAPEIAEFVAAAFANVRDHGTQRFTRRFPFPGGAGVFDSLLVPVRDAAGRVARILGASREVTDQVRLEEELRQTQKMQAMGQMTGGVAHDFNNLLTGISGSLELLAREVTTERGRRLLDAAQRSTERGARLTAHLLAFSRRQQLQARPLDLAMLVGGMAGLLRSTLGAAIQVETRAAPNLWPAMADATQVELAILNAALNARDAMPEGGTIVIETANAQTGPPQTPEDPPAGAHVMVAISDSGTGMTEEVLARVFEPFFTTKDVGRGSGLGLPQMLGVAKQLGGGVQVASRPNAGTVVRLYLPRAASAPVDAPLAVMPLAAEALRGTRVLVIDDEAEVREAAAGLLEELGCIVLRANGGAAALAMIEAGARVDAALVDYAMPAMNGAETIARLRVLRPRLGVVVATGYADLEALARIDARVVRKPFRSTDLAAALSSVMAEQL